MAKKRITATWSKTQEGEWQLLAVLPETRKTPKPGEGLGSEHEAFVYKKGSKEPAQMKIRLTSRVFRSQDDSKLRAYAEKAEQS